MAMKFLRQAEDRLLQRERKVLAALRETLLDLGISKEERQALEESILQLDDFFLLVVVGEFNAGKSALINALLGQSVLKEGVTPTTTQVHVLRYGETQAVRPLGEHLLEFTAPVPLLQELSIVDTPGTNAVIREHEVITNRFVPRADLVLFVTSADRPFSESERAFMEQIRAWGKKIVLVLNKADLLADEAALTEVLDFIREMAQTLLGFRPEIFPVSAKLALQGKAGDTAAWEASRFAALEAYIRDTLDQRERVRLKLLNPLGVGLRLAQASLEQLRRQAAVLEDDLQVIERVERQLQVYQEDMRRGFTLRMAEIDNILLDMEQRARDYFEETIRFGRVMDLIRKERIQKEFRELVIGDMPQRIEARVNGLIDWLVEAELRQWQAVDEHLKAHREKYRGQMVGGELREAFRSDRERLMESVARRAREIVANYDRDREARQLAEDTQAAVAAAAAIQVGAVGLGALITALATTVTADVTGIALAGVMAALGLFIIPARRRQAIAEMHRKVTHLRETLSRALRDQFEHEMQRSLETLREAMAPYTRFVRAEHERTSRLIEALENSVAELERLKAEIEALA